MTNIIFVLGLFVVGIWYLSGYECHYTGSPSPEVVDTCSKAFNARECMYIHGHQKVWVRP